MVFRFSLALAMIIATAGALPSARRAVAADNFYKGPDGGNWNVAGSWEVIYHNEDNSVITTLMMVPRGSGGFNQRAAIGTDNPAYGLSKSVVLDSPLPSANATIHGLALGMRQRYNNTANAYVNPVAPAPGTMVGSLTISGTTTALNNISGPHAAIGGDGGIKVGVEGRGYLTMLGGTLTGTYLEVSGEDVSTGNGTSLLDLRGASTLTVTGSGTSTLGRRLRVEGPNVNFTTGGNLTLQSTNSYTAVITSPTAHSPLKTNTNALLGGSLFVEFSGAGATHSLGQTWNLVDAVGGIPGPVGTLFNNLGPGAQVSVSGLPSSPPLGTTYRLQKVTNPSDNHTLLQLAYQGLLVLRVNRDTGELALTNPHGASIQIENYEIYSPLGSLLPTYKGISGAPAGDSGWEKVPLNSATGLAELKPVGNLNMTSVSSLTLGTGPGRGFDRFAVASAIANFGTDGEDLTFFYNTSEGRIQGHVEYIGTKFENNLVLRVNPTTGVAYLKNDSHETVTFDGYSILSSTNSLVGSTWTGLGGTWQKTDNTPASLSETNLLGSTTLAAGTQVAIGDIGAFTTVAAQDGLSMRFILAQSLTAPEGDYNGDGTVDAADYVVWRKTDGTQAGYDTWRANFGATGGGPEPTFRLGSVVFDTTAGSGAGGVSAVPEPHAFWLMLGSIFALCCLPRRRHSSPRLQPSPVIASQQTFGQLGGYVMSRRVSGLWAAAACCAAMLTAFPAFAVTQGIKLVNYDFEDPGPPGVKTVAYDNTGNPISGIIPGWTFTCCGTETFGDGIPGDSGTEGGGNPGQEMLLSVNDGKAYQIASDFTIQSIPSTQIYKFAFDAHDVFTRDATGATLADSAQLTARFFYGAWAEGQRTLLSQPIDLAAGWTRYEFTIPHNSPLLQSGFGALGQTIGIEFTTTSKNRNPLVDKSWAGIDNVVLEIAPVLEGDFNGSGTITAADYDILRGNLEESACYTSPAGIRGCPFEADGELTGDRTVNLNDFRAFKTLYEAANGAGSFHALLGRTNVPEPTTCGLLVIAGAVIACSRRRRMRGVFSSKRNGLPLVVCGSALLIMTANATAELKYYDAFRYNESNPSSPNPAIGQYAIGGPTPLGGQNPIMNCVGCGTDPMFFNTPWESPTPLGDMGGGVVKPTTISYIGTESIGGSAQTENANTPPATAAGNSRTGRFLKTPWTDATDGETWYLSFVANFGTTIGGGGMGYRAVEFFPDGTPQGGNWAESRWGDVGYNEYYGYGSACQQDPDCAKLAVTAFGEQKVLIGAPESYNQDGRNHLIVYRFDFSSTPGMDNLRIYLDPVSTAEPEVASADFLNRDFTLAAISAMSRFGGGTTGIFDELRIGTTFPDVLPPGLPCPGDTNGDCIPDLTDYATIRDNFHRTNANGPAEGDVAFSDGRMGFDGRVDGGDFFLWRRVYEEYLQSGGGAGGGNLTVPEPSAAMLAIILAVFVVTAQRGGARRA